MRANVNFYYSKTAVACQLFVFISFFLLTRLSGGPMERSSAEQVNVKVEHRLAGIPP